MKILRMCLTLLVSTPALACAWTFSPVITVSELNQPRTFMHLESSGNRSVAISGHVIAVTWEDNHRGKPAANIAFKRQDAAQFSHAVQVSEEGPAYEPAVAGLLDGRFVVVWEAKDKVWSRIVSPQQSGPVQQLAHTTAREVTVTAADGQLWLAWAERAGAHFHIVAARASVQGDRLHLAKVKPVDPAPAIQDQLYPSIALTRDGTTIAWEDRRYGHTRIFTAHAARGKWFSTPGPLNQLKGRRSMTFGKGTGAMRVVLASDGQRRIVGSWLDKRDFAEGYDVYAAVSDDNGKTFGRNEKVEDMLGANQAQWHAVSAMDSQDHAVVAWDDQRDGSPDVWLSWQTATGWSDDDSPAAAHGNGSQSHPAMVFDEQGRLHLVFLDRANGKTAIRYLLATPAATDFGAGQ